MNRTIRVRSNVNTVVAGRQFRAGEPVELADTEIDGIQNEIREGLIEVLPEKPEERKPQPDPAPVDLPVADDGTTPPEKPAATTAEKPATEKADPK